MILDNCFCSSWNKAVQIKRFVLVSKASVWKIFWFSLNYDIGIFLCNRMCMTPSHIYVEFIRMNFARMRDWCYIYLSPQKKTMWKFERKLISSMYFIFTCTFWNFLYMINCWKLFFCKNWTIQSIFPVIHVRMYPTMVFSFCWFHLLMQCNRTLKVGFVTWYQHYRELL